MTITSPYVVTALLAKRKEVARQVKAADAALRKLRIELDHIDGTIRLMAPDVKPEELPEVREGRATPVKDLHVLRLEVLAADMPKGSATRGPLAGGYGIDGWRSAHTLPCQPSANNRGEQMNDDNPDSDTIKRLYRLPEERRRLAEEMGLEEYHAIEAEIEAHMCVVAHLRLQANEALRRHYGLVAGETVLSSYGVRGVFQEILQYRDGQLWVSVKSDTPNHIGGYYRRFYGHWKKVRPEELT